MTALNLEIISPTAVIFKGNCHLAVIPAVEGEIGVMHGHEAVVTPLHSGQISLYDDKQNLLQSFEVSNGFAEINADRLLVLLDN